MHRSRCDSIDSDAFRSEIFGQRAREGDDCTLGGRIVNHSSRAAKGDCRCGVNDTN
jgi:hypothetical protein